MQLRDYYKNVARLQFEKVVTDHNTYYNLDQTEIISLHGADTVPVLALGSMFWYYSFQTPVQYPITSYVDYLHNDLYNKISKSLVFNEQVSTRASLALDGGTLRKHFFVAVHVRRGDYASKCMELPEELQDQCRTTASFIRRYLRARFSDNQREALYVSTNANAQEAAELSRELQMDWRKVVFQHDLAMVPLSENSTASDSGGLYDEDGIETTVFDQLICASASHFVGNAADKLVVLKRGIPFGRAGSKLHFQHCANKTRRGTLCNGSFQSRAAARKHKSAPRHCPQHARNVILIANNKTAMLALALLDLVATAVLVRFIAGFLFGRLHHRMQWSRHSRWRGPSAWPADSRWRGWWHGPNDRRHGRGWSSAPCGDAASDAAIDAAQIPLAFLHEHFLAAALGVDAPAAANPSAPQPQSQHNHPARTPVHYFEEAPQQFVATVELPGYARADIETTVADDIRQVKVRAANEARGVAEAAFVVPRLGNLDAVSASLADGVLRVVVPKKEADGRVVQVTAVAPPDSVHAKGGADDGYVVA
ncbi:hypothetical protein HDU84_009151 [Entophlyctis sp. JEL0112]|nr:hypothetical protein HDU84_009151 [Entophlyctis sp. JEL0112]